MKSNALKKVVILCAALAATVTASGFSVDAAQRSAKPGHQEVNGTAKTDRLARPDVVAMVARTEKADRIHQSGKSEVEFKFEPVSVRKTSPAGEVLSKGKPTPVAVDHSAAPVTRINDDPGAVVEPAADTDGTSRNYSEDPAEKNPSSWSGWSYSKGLMERTDRRSRFLWNMLIDRYEEGWER